MKGAIAGKNPDTGKIEKRDFEDIKEFLTIKTLWEILGYTNIVKILNKFSVNYKPMGKWEAENE